MVTLLKKSPKAIFQMLFLALLSDQIQAQTPLVVQKMEPATPKTTGSFQQIASTAAPINSGTNAPITLQNLQSGVAPPKAETAAPPVTVKTMAPARKNDQDIKKGQLSVEQMIHSPTDYVQLFSQLNIDRSFSVDALPANAVRSYQADAYGGLDWSPSGYCWQSPAFCFSPLYFEQPNLERYGQGTGPILDPALSAAYFFGQVTVLPIRAMWQPPWSKSCTLGHHRPGDCAPIQRRPTIHDNNASSTASTPVVVKISE